MASSEGDNKDVVYLTQQLAVARSEINNLRQQLKSLTHAHRKDCTEIQNRLDSYQCEECRVRMECEEEVSNSEPSLKYIGVVRTQFPEKRATPRQPGICPELIAKLTLDNNVLTNPGHALEGLQEFSHMWILFHFHRNDSTHVRAKVAPPRLNGLRTGVFATRSPHRPSPIGLSLVKIDRIMENTIYFSGVDMVDQTPVFDIKPYIPQYDNPGLDTTLNTITYEEINDEDMSEGENLARVLDGDENGGQASSSTDVRNLGNNVEEAFYSRSTSRIGEREAPDGEEGEEAPRPSGSTGDFIRIPSWINQPRTQQLKVFFKDSVLAQLNQFGAAEAEERIRTINNVLREDPRSVYLRYRSGSNCYVFRIAALYISCKFNNAENSVTVFKISQISDSTE